MRAAFAEPARARHARGIAGEWVDRGRGRIRTARAASNSAQESSPGALARSGALATEVPTYSRARGRGRGRGCIGPRGRADVGGAIVRKVKRLSDGAEETLYGSRRDDLGRRESARALPKCNGNLAKKRVQKNLTRLRRGRGQLYLVGVLTLSRSQWGMAGHEIHAWGSPRRVLSRGSEVSEVGGAKRRACSGHLHNLAANGRVSHPLAAPLFGG